LATGCGATGQAEVAFPLTATGSAAVPLQDGDQELVLSSALIGFGPFYGCATRGASRDLCPVATVEVARTVVFDGLDPAPQEAGDVLGVTGAVRSVMFDYAVTWDPSESLPTPGLSAPLGHSAHFEGSVMRPSGTVSFVMEMDATPQFRGTFAVQGARTTGEITEATALLDLHFDPNAWWANVDQSEIRSAAEDPVVLGPETRAYAAIFQAMTATALPSFSFSGSLP
jgi:hypothetical protein